MATFFQAMRIGRVGVMEEICRKQLPLILVPTGDCGICGVQERFRVVFAPLIWEASASLLNVLHAVSSGSKRASFDWSFRKSVKNCEDESTAANHICFLEKPRRMRFKMFQSCMHVLLTLLTEQCCQWTHAGCACVITSKDSRGAAVCAASQGIRLAKTRFSSSDYRRAEVHFIWRPSWNWRLWRLWSYQVNRWTHWKHLEAM